MRFLSPSADDSRGSSSQGYGETVIREPAPTANPGREAAFRESVRLFVEGPRLDLSLLAEELDVPVSAVEGWWPVREMLLAEVLDHFAELAFNQAEADTVNMQGLDRVLSVGRTYIGLIVTFEPLRRFFRAESQLALEILTTPGDPVQSGVVSRMIEGFIYNDPLADIEPDVDQAIVILGLLLE